MTLQQPDNHPDRCVRKAQMETYMNEGIEVYKALGDHGGRTNESLAADVRLVVDELEALRGPLKEWHEKYEDLAYLVRTYLEDPARYRDELREYVGV